MMIERVINFGKHGNQVGILCLPPGEQAGSERPAVIMWNVGVNHRVGPFRVYVDLSRKLAALGFIAFRFDSSGMGDSDVRRDAISSTEREDLDVQDALDAVMRRSEAKRFVLIGFCSSIDAAHRVSVKDERVVGVIHLEGYSFRTRRYLLNRPRRLLSPQRWRRFAEVRRARLEARLKGGSAPTLPREVVFKRDYPTWPAFARDLVTLTRRNVSLLFAYVGSDTDYNYPEQFWDMFARPDLDRTKIEVEYYPQADHTFFAVEIREQLLERITRWLCKWHISTSSAP